MALDVEKEVAGQAGWRALEAGKGKETGGLLGPPESEQRGRHLGFSPAARLTYRIVR